MIRDRERASGLARRFKIERRAGSDRCFEFAIALAGAGETDVGGRHAACERRLEFAARRDVEPVDEPHHEGEERRIGVRSEEHTSELQSLMRISYAVFCLKKTTYITLTYNILEQPTFT